MAEEMIDANTELTAFVESCSDNDWRAVCPAEKWRVGVVAHHVAWGHERAADWINAIRRGIPIPGSPQAHNARNTIEAAQVAGISRNEVIFLARRNVERLVAVLRSLTDEDFETHGALRSSSRTSDFDRWPGPQSSRPPSRQHAGDPAALRMQRFVG
jgi:hypothetical protein